MSRKYGIYAGVTENASSFMANAGHPSREVQQPPNRTGLCRCTNILWWVFCQIHCCQCALPHWRLA